MNREILAEWNPWWTRKPEFGLLQREILKEVFEWVDRREIVGILGVRRSGKTSLLNLVIEHLLAAVNPENILFIKCDDDRAEKGNLISRAVDLYKEFVNPKGKIFVFIDEVREAEGWENTLKRIYDLEKGIKIFISGSNFSLSKEDFASKLAGRFAYFELYPFSFQEFLNTKGIATKSKINTVSRKHEIKHYLLQYTERGGFPEVVLEADGKKKTQLLQFYFDTIVYRDIIKKRE